MAIFLLFPLHRVALLMLSPATINGILEVFSIVVYFKTPPGRTGA